MDISQKYRISRIEVKQSCLEITDLKKQNKTKQKQNKQTNKNKKQKQNKQTNKNQTKTNKQKTPQKTKKKRLQREFRSIL